MKYLPVTEEISVDITLEEALSLISVDSNDGDTADTVSWLPPANTGARADFIKRKTKEVRPKHVNVVCKNSNLRNVVPGEKNLALIAPLSSSKGEGSGRGRKSDHDYIAYCNGWCGFKKEGCPTKLFVGFDYSALSAIVAKSAKVSCFILAPWSLLSMFAFVLTCMLCSFLPSIPFAFATPQVPLKMKFIGNCRHPKNGSGVGQVRGSVRQEMIEKITVNWTPFYRTRLLPIRCQAMTQWTRR